MVPSNVNNEKAFELGKGTIKIQYDRVYTHTMNEFMHIMFGNDGLYYDGSMSTKGLQEEQSSIYKNQTEAQLSRTNDIRKIYTQKIPDHNDKEMEFKNIVDASEALCTNNMKSLGFNALGNYAGVPNDPQINIGTSPIKLTEFYDLKLKMLKNDMGLNDVLANMSGNTGKMIGRLIEEYNNRRGVIKAQWPESRKNITTDKWGHMIAMTQAQQAGNLYWITKLAQMKDGYVVPEVGAGNMPGQFFINPLFSS